MFFHSQVSVFELLQTTNISVESQQLTVNRIYKLFVTIWLNIHKQNSTETKTFKMNDKQPRVFEKKIVVNRFRSVL